MNFTQVERNPVNQLVAGSSHARLAAQETSVATGHPTLDSSEPLSDAAAQAQCTAASVSGGIGSTQLEGHPDLSASICPRGHDVQYTDAAGIASVPAHAAYAGPTAIRFAEDVEVLDSSNMKFRRSKSVKSSTGFGEELSGSGHNEHSQMAGSDKLDTRDSWTASHKHSSTHDMLATRSTDVDRSVNFDRKRTARYTGLGAHTAFARWSGNVTELPTGVVPLQTMHCMHFAWALYTACLHVLWSSGMAAPADVVCVCACFVVPGCVCSAAEALHA